MSVLLLCLLASRIPQADPRPLQQWYASVPAPARDRFLARIAELETRLDTTDVWVAADSLRGLCREGSIAKLSWQQQAAVLLTVIESRKGKAAAALLHATKSLLLQLPVTDPLEHYPSFSKFLLKAAASVAADADRDLRLAAILAMNDRASGDTHVLADRKVPLDKEEKELIRVSCTRALKDPDERIRQKAKEAIEKLGT